MTFYERLGIRRVINARAIGVTGLGASIMRPEVAEAMLDASKSFVYIRELKEQVGEVIARVVGAEAGCVVNSAAAGIVAMAAACMCGPNQVKLSKLPNTDGLKNEVIVLWGQMTHYLKGSGNCIEITGARMKVIGSTTGSRVGMGDFKAELEEAIDGNTAAVCYTISDECMQRFWQLELEDAVEVAHKRHVPVFVDAAAYTDLKYPTAAGADLATFSGGKTLGGPTSSAIVCGRKDLVRAVELTEWTICRSMKVGKEEMAGLLVALEHYAQRDWSQWASTTATREQANRWAKYIFDRLIQPPIPYVNVSLNRPLTYGMWVPDHEKQYSSPQEVRLVLNEERLGMTAHEVYESVGAGNPSILISNHNEEMGFLDVRTSSLIEGEEVIVAERLLEVLTKRTKTIDKIPYP